MAINRRSFLGALSATALFSPSSSSAMGIPIPEVQVAAGVISAAFAVASFFDDDQDRKIGEILVKLDKISSQLKEIQADLNYVKLRVEYIAKLIEQMPTSIVDLLYSTKLSGIDETILNFAKTANNGGGGTRNQIVDRLNFNLDSYIAEVNSYIALHAKEPQGAAFALSIIASREINLTRLVMSFQYGDNRGSITDPEGYKNDVHKRLRVRARDNYIPFFARCINDDETNPIDVFVKKATELRIDNEKKLNIQGTQISLGCRTWFTEGAMSRGEPSRDGGYWDKRVMFVDLTPSYIEILSERYPCWALDAIWYQESYEYGKDHGSRYPDVFTKYDLTKRGFVAVDKSEIPRPPARCSDTNLSIPEHRIAAFNALYASYISSFVDEVVSIGHRKSIRSALKAMAAFTKE